MEKMLTEKEVANFLGITVGSVRAWRKKREKLAYYKIGGSIRYRMSDVEEFLAGCLVTPKSA